MGKGNQKKCLRVGATINGRAGTLSCAGNLGIIHGGGRNWWCKG